MTTNEKLQQEKFEESNCGLKIGDKVRHKANESFDMVVTDFKIEWINNQYLIVNGIKNPDFPICRYYDTNKKEWVERFFKCSDLVRQVN